MLLTLIPFLTIQTAEADTTITITSLSVANIQNTIQTAIANTSPGNTITVTGDKGDENAIITLNIPTNITVVWKATSKDLSFNIDGGGNFEVAESSKIETSNKNAIEVENGNVIVSGGEVFLVNANYNIAIYVKNGNVTVSSGKVSVIGSAPSAIEVNTGNITVSDGEISVDTTGTYSYTSYALSINTLGTIVVTGGSVSAIPNPIFGELNQNSAIYLYNGIAAYLQGVCSGKFDSPEQGIIVEVESLTIPSSYAGTNNGLTHKDGIAISNVKWDFSGTNPAISFKRMRYIVEWKAPVTEQQNPSTVDSVRLTETGALFDTLNEAIEAAKNLHYTTFTLEVIGNVAETSSVIIGSENVAIIGKEGAHTFAFTNPPQRWVSSFL